MSANHRFKKGSSPIYVNPHLPCHKTRFRNTVSIDATIQPNKNCHLVKRPISISTTISFFHNGTTPFNRITHDTVQVIFGQILRVGASTGYFREENEDYGTFLKRVISEEHHSCVIVTGREQPYEILEGNNKTVKSIILKGLESEIGGEYLRSKNVDCSNEQARKINERYQGNPLALSLLAEYVTTVFNGDVNLFFKQDEITFGSIRDVLQNQFSRLSSLEHQVLSVIALSNGSIDRKNLIASLRFIFSADFEDISKALISLAQRSLVEIKLENIYLQPVVLEYIREQLTKFMSNTKLSLSNQDNIITVFLSYASGLLTK